MAVKTETFFWSDRSGQFLRFRWRVSCQEARSSSSTGKKHRKDGSFWAESCIETEEKLSVRFDKLQLPKAKFAEYPGTFSLFLLHAPYIFISVCHFIHKSKALWANSFVLFIAIATILSKTWKSYLLFMSAIAHNQSYLNKVFGLLKPNGATWSGFIDKVW